MQARETMNCMSPYKISTENPFDPPAANLRCVATFVALSESKRPKLPRGIHWVSHSPNIWFSWRDADRKQHHVLAKSRHLAKARQGRWDVNRPMKTWMKSWRKLVQAAGIGHFRFHDLRHTFRTQGAEAGVPLEIMMAQIGHIDRESSLEYVHIQQRGFDQIKRLIGRKQAAVLAVAQRRSTHAE